MALFGWHIIWPSYWGPVEVTLFRFKEQTLKFYEGKEDLSQGCMESCTQKKATRTEEALGTLTHELHDHRKSLLFSAF